MAIKTYERKTKFAELGAWPGGAWCHMSKPHDFIEVTEWHNGEGVDVCINSSSEQRFSLTWGQWEALQALVAYKE